MPEGAVSVLDGSTFVVGDQLGDICLAERREQGFFSDDTRFVSRWVLRVDQTPLQLLGLDQEAHFAAQFFMTALLGPDDQVPYSVIRHRLIDHVWLEEIAVTNHCHTAREVRVALDVGADFADLFEIKDGTPADRQVTIDIEASALRLTYRRADYERSVTVAADVPPTAISGSGFIFALALDPGERWAVTFTVTPYSAQPGRNPPSRRARATLPQLRTSKAAELDRWLAEAPLLPTDDATQQRTYRTSLADLGALRLHPDLADGATLPAAGLPWFMALFGRDSLITSYQALPYLPELAATTLRVLAARQATERDDFHEQEPGKILHELRFGELTVFGDRPHSPYFGTADATPLFLILLDEYHRWTGDDDLVRELEPHARAALSWIDDSGDIDGDGYVEYSRRNPSTGLANQCWKDSWDSIQFADGTLARGPIATCEIQGYVYDARRRSSRLARELWGDDKLAERLESQAADLRKQFQADFWMPERGCHALALDGDKRKVDSLTSNIGHLLWSGIVDEDQAAVTAQRLMGDELNSGWGVRTLGAAEAGYNPLGYHTGTVWPHENSLIAAGLARYGFRVAAAAVASAIFAAAPHFDYRLPEVFAGYPAAMTRVPVAFPTASRPQAWAAGAPLLLLTTLLDLHPDPSRSRGLPDRY